eukprot:2345730-Rhodomonas_salina.3
MSRVAVVRFRVEVEGGGRGWRVEGLFQGQALMSRVAGVRSGVKVEARGQARGSKVQRPSLCQARRGGASWY